MSGAAQHPYELEVSVKSRIPDCPTTFRAIAPFPWVETDIDRLWGGEFKTLPSMRKSWVPLVRKWSGVVAVGGGSQVRLILTRPSQPYLHIHTMKVPKDMGEVTAIAWAAAVNSEEISILLAFAAGSVIYIRDLETGEDHGILIGHGGKINALAVHPVDPSKLASASHDYSVRIYNLIEEVAKVTVNPKWPVSNSMAMGGPAFGLRANEKEGEGFGNCYAILCGGPSGGHRAAVLDLAFHPTLPIIATCGLDHAVKIWRIPEKQGAQISREDKPVFSSSHIHRSRVTSITWMSEDILLTHSARVALRQDIELGEDAADSSLYYRPGTLVLWQWLGLRRFFPEGLDEFPSILRGCFSDFSDSSSYKVIAEYLTNPRVGIYESIRATVFQSPNRVPLIAIPWSKHINLTSLSEFKPAQIPPFQLNRDPEVLSETNEGPRKEYFEILPELPGVPVEKGDSEEKLQEAGSAARAPPMAMRVGEEMKACTFVENGRVIVGVGEREGIWIWRDKTGAS